MGKELFVREVEEARGIIRHDIAFARDKIMKRDVAVKALVAALEAQEVGRRARRSRGAFALPEEGWGVVTITFDSTFSDIKTLGCCFVMKDTASKF